MISLYYLRPTISLIRIHDQALDAAGITLSIFISDIFGKSGRHLLDGLVARKSLNELIPGIPTNRIRKRADKLPEHITVQLDDTQVFLIGKALSTVDYIQKNIDEIDAMLYARAEAHTENLKILMSIPGIKFIAAITILAEIGNYNDFENGDQLACYAGLTPVVQSRQVYLRLMRRKGKPKAITALSRKILCIMYHLLVNREMWNEDGFKKRRLDFDFDRTSSSSQLTWLDLAINNVVSIGKGKPGGGG